MAAGLGFIEFTTGDILTAATANGYLASQTVMVFADAAARTTAITSPQEGMICYLKDTDAVEKYTGSAWVSVGGGSPLTTKGDVYTYSTTDARLAVGANGTVLTADSAEATGLKWAAAAGGGKILQVVRATDTTARTTTSTSFVDANISVTITPQKNTSAILLIWSSFAGPSSTTSGADVRQLLRITDSSNNAISGGEDQRAGVAGLTSSSIQYSSTPATVIAYATPATLSPVTFKGRFAAVAANVTANLVNNVNTGQLYAIEVDA